MLRPTRRWAKRAAAALLGGCAGLLVLAALELAARRDPSWRVLDAHDPPFASLGLKRQFGPDAFPSSDRRVVFVGGSTTAGFPFPLAAVAEWTRAELARCGESAVSVENRGLGSYGSLRETLVLREALERPAAAVVFYPGHNEDLERRLVRSLPRWQLSGPVPWLYRRSALLTLAVRALLKRPRPVGLTLGGVFGYPVSYGPPPDRAKLAAAFQARLRAMLRLTRARGAKALLCVAPVNPHFRPPFPAGCQAALLAREDLDAGRPQAALSALRRASPRCLAQWSSLWLEGTALEGVGRTAEGRAFLLRYADDAAPSPELFRRIERRVGRQEGAVLVDVEARFAAGTRDGLPADRYFADSHHLSQEGDRAAARQVVRALAREGLVSRACPAPWPKSSRRSGPYGMFLSDMGEDLPLPPRYAAIPAMTLANVYGFYAGDSSDDWFRRRALAWTIQALSVDEKGILPHLRRDNPLIAELVREAYAALAAKRRAAGAAASSTSTPASAPHKPRASALGS